jgi:hypothetical protein
MLNNPFSNVSVAVVGSRFGSPFGVSIVCYSLVGSGCSLVTGCAAGVDRTVRASVPSTKVITAMSFVRRGLPVVAALAARTQAVVQQSQAVCIFPPASGHLGVGSSLALQTAIAAGLPVWVAGPVAPTRLGWQSLTLGGVAGWFFNAGLNSLF